MPLQDERMAVPAISDGVERAVIFGSELDFIHSCMVEYPRSETGGQMFGLWTDRGVPVVLYVIGPGPSAGHDTTFFSQDIGYLRRVSSVIMKEWGLQHVGEWHSHHVLGLSRPSGHDAANIAGNMRKAGYRKLLLCIGTIPDEGPRLDAYTFRSDREGYFRSCWDVLPLESPFRRSIDRSLGARIGNGWKSSPLEPEEARGGETPSYGDRYWLSDRSNNKELKVMADYLASTHKGWECVPTVDSENHVHIILRSPSSSRDVYFPHGFPYRAPVVTETSEGFSRDFGTWPWSFDGSISDSFIRYCKNLGI